MQSAAMRKLTTARRTKLRRNQRGYQRTSGAIGKYEPVGFETKWVDTYVNADNVNTTGTRVDSINEVAIGNSQNERIGNKILITSIEVRGVYGLNPAAVAETSQAITCDSMRMIMYLDEQCNGAVAAVPDILRQDDGVDPGDWINKFYNKDNNDRFTFICDKLFTAQEAPYINVPGTSQNKHGRSQDHFWFVYDVAIPVYFSGSTGGLTEIRSNNVGIMLFSDQGGIDTKFRVRMNYSDLQ